MEYFPGTVIDAKNKDAANFLNGAFIYDEINLTQLIKITGLSQSTIQNWVNRGFVAKTNGKGYDKDKVARILIINMLRQTMSLENVAAIMYYINGKTEETSDDIVRESTLYLMVCSILFDKNYSQKNLNGLIEKQIQNVSLNDEEKKRLFDGISIITRAFTAAEVIKGINRTMDDIVKYLKSNKKDED